MEELLLRITKREQISNGSILMLLVLLMTIFSGCVQDNKPKEKKVEPGEPRVTAEKIDTLEATPPSIVREGSIDWQEIRFSDVSLFVERMEGYWDDDIEGMDDPIYFANKDTLYFDLFPGEWFYDKSFRFEDDNIVDVKLYHRDVNHIGINSNQIMEVPFCVLNDLREWTSEWKEVSLVDGLKLNEADGLSQPNLNVTPEEIRERVQSNCGERWVEEFEGYSTL